MEKPIQKEVYNLEKLANMPIPKLASVAGWKEVPLEPSDEPMVATGELTEYPFFSSSIYYGEHENSPYNRGQIKGSFVTMFMRKGVADRLARLEEKLPKGYKIIVFDAYRSLEVQDSLYREYYNGLKEKHPDWTDDQLATETQKYVSIPSNNPTRPSPHNTGGSVDLGIVRLSSKGLESLDNLELEVREGNFPNNSRSLALRRNSILLDESVLLEFGTEFDFGGKEAGIRFLEEKNERGEELTDNEKEALKNRRILYHTMIDVGFEAYEDEWWHFNAPESQMGAKTAGISKAFYAGTDIPEELLVFERQRANLSSIAQVNSSLPKAAIIKPSDN